jgi:hypothetical protein
MSVVEVLIALGVFMILMGVVSAVLISGIRSMRQASTANLLQGQQQSAIEWVARLIRYADSPTTASPPPPAILQATATSLSLFTYAGTGTVDRQPYKALICTTLRGVESFIWEPALVNGVPVNNVSPNLTIPTCDDAGAIGARRRVLVPVAADHQPSIAFRYWRARTATDAPGTGDVEVVPVGALTAEQIAEVDKVQVILNDTLVTVPLEQTVLLVNER